MLRKSLIVISILIINITCLLSQSKLPGNDRLCIDSIKKHISFLADDSLQGRGTGQKGGYAAADYISSRLSEYKLEPAINRKNYFQQIPFTATQVSNKSELLLYDNNLIDSLYLEKDYLVYSSGNDSYIPVPVPMVFVGFGVIAPEYDYNDYQSIDVEGKIVVFLSGEPVSEDKKYFSGNVNTFHSLPEMKQRIALSRGARGTMMILNPLDISTKDWNYYIHQYSFEEVSLAYARTDNLSIIVNFILTEKLFDKYSSSNILEMIRTNSVKSFPLVKKLSFKGKRKDRNFTAPNIISIKEGDDPELKDTYLLLSAHYDHLGIGKSDNGDSIYNGAMDNAAGVSVLLEIASIINDIKTKRSIIFLFTTAEEKGLLGSSYYVDNPLFPLYKTIANINIDGLAFLDSFGSIFAVGAEFSTLGELLDSAIAKLKMKRQRIVPFFNTSESFSNSDQFTFAKAGIPSLIITEGVDTTNLNEYSHTNKLLDWMKDIYHTPKDDTNQKIDYRVMLQHANIILMFIEYLANHVSEPVWKDGVPFINARLNSIAERR